MSKDIRSFFKLQSGSKATPKSSDSLKKRALKGVITDEDDSIPESPDARSISKNNKSKKKRRIVVDSSDEDIPDRKPHEKSAINEKDKNTKKAPIKEVSAADIFGSGPIKRTEIPQKDNHKIEAEVIIHSDEDFDRTLLQLDDSLNASNSIILKDCHKIEDTTKKNYVISKKSSNNESASCKEDENQIIDSGKEKDGTESHKKSHETNLAEYKIPKKPKCDVSREILHDKKESPVKKEKKRDFSEFLENQGVEEKSEDYSSSKTKKRKCDQSLNESVISDEERFEKKRLSAILYKNYLNRTGPANPGSKAIPEGAPNCLKDLAFVLTGVLSSFEKEEITEVIQKYGGTVKSGVSKKVTHVLAGDDAGPAKLAKAEDLGLIIINEDQFLDLIKRQSKTSEQDTSKNEQKHKNDRTKVPVVKMENGDNEKDVIKESSMNKETDIKKEKGVTKEKHINNDRNLNNKNYAEKQHNKKKEKDPNKEISQFKKDAVKVNGTDHMNCEKEKDEIEPKKTPKNEMKAASFYKTSLEKDVQPSTSKMLEPVEISSQSSKDSKSSSSISSIDAATLMWVEKYKPKTAKQIIGQNGDASNVKKLTNWLMRWYINRKEKLSKPSPWAKNDDGGYYKAALLSGPPGIGKTTAVTLVCAELGFDVVELNASDTRSKTLVRDQISELLTTNSLAGYVSGQAGRKALSKKHVLVMDEVDGMAGNEDRGGLQELIALIKRTSVPIVCTCNDRNSTKMRSLVNYCYDLRFSRPRVDQIKSAMMSVCFKEGVKIPPETLSQLIVSANQDVRQTLNLLSMWAARGAPAEGSVTAKKDVKLGPWEAVRKVFSAEEHKSMSIHDKSDLFFYDYSIAPLFVQENYLQVVPHCPKDEVLRRVSRAADSISLGDLVEARVRGAGAWSLLPVQALCSSVLPGHAMAGHVAGQIQFPGWLGKNSRAGKMQRLAQEIHAHTRLSASGSKSSIFLDYSRHLYDALVLPLARDKTEGIASVLELLQAYHLLREDLDSLGELALWPGRRDPMLLVDSKVKAAMTRAYNREAAALPYAQAAARRARPGAGDAAEGEAATVGAGAEAAGEEGAEAEEEEAETDSDPESDAMIVKKKAARGGKEAAKSVAKGGKGKKGKGKA